MSGRGDLGPRVACLPAANPDVGRDAGNDVS